MNSAHVTAPPETPSLLPHSCPPADVAMGKGVVEDTEKVLGEKDMLLKHCHHQEPYLDDGLKCLRGQLSWRLTSACIHHNHPASSALPHPCSRRSTCYLHPALSVSSPCQADQSPLFCLAVFTLPRDFLTPRDFLRDSWGPDRTKSE